MKQSQADRLYNLLSDFQPHRTDEIVEKVYGPGLSLSRVGARVYDVRHKRKLEIKGWHDPHNPKLYWYQIVRPAPVFPPAFAPTKELQTQPTLL